MGPLNPYFNNFSHQRTQKVVEDLIVEAIKIHGYRVKYLPRKSVNPDRLLREDPLRVFEDALEMEVYLKDNRGFQGDREFVGHFGLEVRDQITFTVARSRFRQVLSEKINLQNSFGLSLESANNKVQGQQANVLLESADLTHYYDYTRTLKRPLEGDLIYFPLVNALFEIRYVEYEASFYSFGKLYTYDLKCELYEYSSERITTDDPEINENLARFSFDLSTVSMGIDVEDAEGSDILLEDGSKLLTVTATELSDVDPGAQNKIVETVGDQFIDFSETNPFIKGPL